MLDSACFVAVVKGVSALKNMGLCRMDCEVVVESCSAAFRAHQDPLSTQKHLEHLE